MRKKYLKLTIFGVILLSILSFGKALDYNFWRDDWAFLWMIINDTKLYFTGWVLNSRHPGDFVPYFPWIYIFHTNAFLWELQGLILKIITSLTCGLALYGLTRKKKAFTFGALLFASYFGGLETYTWLSARLSAYLSIFITLGLYFYASSFWRKNTKKRLLAFIFVLMILIFEPSKGIFVLPLFVLWKILDNFVNKKTFEKRFLYEGVLGIFLTFSIFITYLSKFGKLAATQKPVYYLDLITKESAKWMNFFNSIGELFISFFKNITDWGSLISISNPRVAFFGIILLTLSLIFGVILLIKRRKEGPVLILLTIWIPLFYIPSWLSDINLVVGASHRYIAMSSVGLILLVAFLIQSLPNNISYFLLLLFICFNIVRSYQFVENDYKIRGMKVTEPLLTDQEKSVPKDFNGGIFIVNGTNVLKGYVFDWSMGGAIPFALRRGIKDIGSIPISWVNYEQAAELVCKSDIERPSIYKSIIQKNRIPITDVYGWELTSEGKLNSINDYVRGKIMQESPCKEN